MVATARPDLIIGTSFFVEESRTQLEALAPTLVLGNDVLATIRLLGDALDLTERAAQVLAAYEARLVDEVEALVPAGTPPTIVRSDGEGTFSLSDQPGTGFVDLLFRTGFGALPDVPGEPDEFGLRTISLELLEVLRPAEVIVVLGAPPGPTAELVSSALFTALPAVAAGRLLVLDQGTVYQAFNSPGPLNLDTVLPVVRDIAALVS